MTIDKLRQIAEEDNIEILYISCPESGSMSVTDNNGCCFIGMDNRQTSENLERVRLAHELGHCETGSFYTKNTLQLCSKMEYKADKWAIQKIIPFDELLNAVKDGITEKWELAEYFSVTEDYICRAYDIYTAMGKFTG